jgi:hypothetical protein
MDGQADEQEKSAIQKKARTGHQELHLKNPGFAAARIISREALAFERFAAAVQETAAEGRA